MTLPDICAQVENNIKESNKVHYINWINNHMDKDDFHFPSSRFETQTFSGEMCYSLRCKVLHNGNTNVRNSKLNVFVDDMILTKPNDDNYYHGYRYEEKIKSNGKKVYRTFIGIDYLCERICDAVEKFYNEWQNKTDFDSHRIY